MSDTHHSDSSVGQYERMMLGELLAYQGSSRILARWEPVRFMDAGTFSRVFLVRNRQTGEEAVLKFIPNPMALVDCREEGTQEDRFNQIRFAAARREAEIMARFRGQANVVQHLEEPEYLTRAFTDRRGVSVRQYAVLICMPLYRSHREWVPLIASDRAARLRLGIDIAAALEAFEQRGVYHRDIKPANILMDRDGCFCLSDVGEAKLESEFTTIGFHGTRPYMAPEVYRQENESSKMHSDHRSDIYSLGIILYQLFNRGQFPFLREGGTLTEDARTAFSTYSRKHGLQESDAVLTESDRARMLRYDGAKLPPPGEADPQLAGVILRACAYRKEDRFPTAAALREALCCCAEGRPLPKGKKPAHRLMIAGACAAVLAVGAAAMAMLGRPAPVPAATPAPTSVPTAAPTSAPVLSPTPTPAPSDTPTPEPTCTPEPLQGYACTAGDYVQMRANPSADAMLQTVIRGAGTPVELMTRTENEGGIWYLAAYEGSVGYVYAGELRAMTGDELSAYLATPTPSPTPTPTPSPTPTPTEAPTPTRAPVDPDYTYEIRTDEAGQQYAAITGYVGPEDADLVIPASMGELPVREIAERAFFQERELTGALVIPEGVTSIGYRAFYGCKGLTGSLTIPESVTSIGKWAFAYCAGLTGSLIIPEGVTSIGDAAFKGCKGLTGSLVIPEGVTSIGEWAFADCAGLTGSLTIPESVTSIGYRAFSFCKGLTGSLIIPESVTSIGKWAFAYCAGLTGSLIIPEGVTSIGDYAFYGCEGLTGSLTIPEGVTSIGDSAFYGCEGLTGSLTIPESVTSIGDAAFRGCAGLTGSLTIPEGVTSIGYGAFMGCAGLTGSLTIPEGVTYIAGDAFYGCEGLTGSLTIPEGVTYIAGDAFYGCEGLTGSLTIPESVTSIGRNAFGGCRFSEVIDRSGLYAGKSTPTPTRAPVDRGYTYEIRTDEAGQQYAAITGYVGPYDADLVIPASMGELPVREIAERAFFERSELTGALVIPEGVTSIGDSAFYDCEGLTGSLTIPEGVTSIGKWAFVDCAGLTGSLTIPESVTSIGKGAFENCKGLTGSLTIPEGVTSIGDYAFDGCEGLTGSLLIPEGVTSIGDAAFRGCAGLTGSLIIPESVTSIGDSAFRGCAGLTGSLIIPEGVTSIGVLAFADCEGLTGTLTIPSSVTYIGEFAFTGCNFTEVIDRSGLYRK